MRFKHLMNAGTALLIRAKYESFINQQGEEISFIKYHGVELLAEAREKYFNQMVIKLRSEVVNSSFMNLLDSLFAEYPGKVKLQVQLWDEQEKLQVQLTSKKVRLNPQNTLLEALEKLPLAVELVE